MNRPKMILFDFGETLTTEKYVPIEGTKALLAEAVRNKDNITGEEVQALFDELLKEAAYCPDCGCISNQELHMFYLNRYLYEYFGLNFALSRIERERVFLNAAVKSRPTPNIEKLLEYLAEEEIRTAVISNIMYSEQTLTYWIERDLPYHNFEFIVASSEYIFRKPSRRIFEIALKKAKLEPCDTWYCGNHFRCDVEGAYLSGIYPVWYKGAKWESAEEPRDFKYTEIYDWIEMINLLNKGGLD